MKFLERVGRETQTLFDTHELLVLDLVHREERVPPDIRPRLRRLVELGVVESVGRGLRTRYLLSRRFHAAIGQPGAHTRRRGLDREENKALLVRHLRSGGEAGAPISELEQVLPGRSREQIKRMLAELRREGRVRLGRAPGARWFAEAES